MCTVTYIPADTERFAITSNRDERENRPTQPPISVLRHGRNIHFPRDIESGGTWIATSEDGLTCCLLNGAFESHKRKNSYARSRGTVLLEMFNHDTIENAIKAVDLQGVEPFTLIMADHSESPDLVEFRWDEKRKYVKSLSREKSYIWSSATLYTKVVRQEREGIFNAWIRMNPNPESQDILDFHGSRKGMDEANDLIMKRENGLRTVSITQVISTTENFKLSYKDMLTEKITHLHGNIKSRSHA
jgi:hypothetical protein